MALSSFLFSPSLSPNRSTVRTERQKSPVKERESLAAQQRPWSSVRSAAVKCRCVGTFSLSLPTWALHSCGEHASLLQSQPSSSSEVRGDNIFYTNHHHEKDEEVMLCSDSWTTSIARNQVCTYCTLSKMCPRVKLSSGLIKSPKLEPMKWWKCLKLDIEYLFYLSNYCQ